MRVLSGYRPGTTLRHAEDIIDFDRRLRMLVMDGVERIEVALRMRIGYVLGRTSAFAHEAPDSFTEILELGHLSVLYRGMTQKNAEEIATAFGVPTKKLMASWLASLNYVRNVAAHHARLFNRKLQNAPSRPQVGQIPALDHLRDEQTAKGVFGTYNALAVIAHLLPSIDAETEWATQLAALLRDFPPSPALTIESMGAPRGWEALDLWRSWSEESR